MYKSSRSVVYYLMWRFLAAFVRTSLRKKEGCESWQKNRIQMNVQKNPVRAVLMQIHAAVRRQTSASGEYVLFDQESDRSCQRQGGVGKSLVTASLARRMMREKGYKVGILDADITGPSIPKMYGVHTKAGATEENIIPCTAKDGTKIMSVNLLLEDESAPVIWRGPIIASVVKQFWTDVMWGDLDYLFVDMPPGTGDVPLTVFQSLPVDGVVIVTSPQDLDR